MTTKDAPRAKKPLFVAHWDADLYPRQSRPLAEELALHILLHGEVLIKDVDLLHNPAIRTALSEKGVRTQFKSLLETGRVKVLLPPRESTRFDVDPTEQPLTAVAQERHNKRPYKFHIWRFTEPYRRYCATLDPIIKSTGAVRFRARYPETNDFAATLYRILDDQSWRQRKEFKGIDRIADKFAEYCLDPSLAVNDLKTVGVKPLSTEFYRTMAYQCVRLKSIDSSKLHQRRMRTLLQSVYAHCEMTREHAISTYSGDSLAELPAVKEASTASDLSGLEWAAQNLDIRIPVAANIGEILTNVIRDCPRITELWTINEEPSATFRSSESCTEVCASIAQAFATHAVKAEKVKWSEQAEKHWHAIERLHQVIFLINVGIVFGIALVLKDLERVKALEHAIVGVEAITVLAKPIMNGLRTGQAYDDLHTKQEALWRIIYASLRSGSV